MSPELYRGIMNDRYRTTLQVNEQGLIGGSSRVEIMLTDIEIFLDNYLMGVGAGMGRYHKIKYTYGKTLSTMNSQEFGRTWNYRFNGNSILRNLCI